MLNSQNITTSELAILYGVLLGDGCISRTGKAYFISIALNFHSDIPFVTEILPLLKKLRGKEIKPHKRPTYGKIEIIFSDKVLFEKLATIGFPIGKKGINLMVPNMFKDYMTEIVQGYFATDGSLVITNNNGTIYPRVEFSSISKPLLKQVNTYLSSLNFNGNIYLSKKYENHWHDRYRLQLNGLINLQRFRKLIGFINPKHEERYQQLLNMRKRRKDHGTS